MTTLPNGPRAGTVPAPPSKSHEHRLLIANFLAGERDGLEIAPHDAADIRATKRCLRALGGDERTPTLDCGESGSTLRFLAPVAAALGRNPVFRRAGRLAERPFKSYPEILPGCHELPGDVSSQFVTGLLFALPLLNGDSLIRFTSPLESRGYVNMTLRTLAHAGIVCRETETGFEIPGKQRYRAQPALVEGDWSGAAFWLAMNALGSAVKVTGLDRDSAQPDRAIGALLEDFPAHIDVSQFPDIFPVLTVVAAGTPQTTRFTGIRRLRLKECDRVAAMQDVLTRYGRRTTVTETTFEVVGSDAPFAPVAPFSSFGDHRIAMSIAVGATRAIKPVEIDDIACAAKSYPEFFRRFLGNQSM